MVFYSLRQNGSGMNSSSNYATPNSYTPSAQRRSYQQQPTTPTSSRHNLSNGHLANQSNYSYLPPPTRKSPKLPHKQMMPPTGIELEQSSKIVSPYAALSKNKFNSFLKTDVQTGFQQNSTACCGGSSGFSVTHF